jgi:kumamolisin
MTNVLTRISPRSHYIKPSEPSEQATITLVLKRQGDAPKPGSFYDQDGVKRQEKNLFAALHGAHPDTVAAVRQFAADKGLSEVSYEGHKRALKVSGTVAALEQAFGVSLHEYGHLRDASQQQPLPEDTYRCVHGYPQLPEGVVAALGLDRRPVAKPYLRQRATAHDIQGPANTYSPVALGGIYNFPTQYNGAGQCIAIIELGGGYDESDMVNYFHEVGVLPPKLTAIPVSGGSNTTGSEADGEVQLDIEVAGALAPGASFAIYFTTNSDEGFHDAIAQAAHDAVNKPLVMSISWGGPENGWGDQAIQAIEAALEDAAAFGVTITVAAGDNGAADGEQDGSLNADYPSSSPSVISCGGTHLIATGETITLESVWNDDHTDGDGATGGGVSQVFPLPAWQSKVGVPLNPIGKPGRGVPDVAGVADPDTGYRVAVNGQDTVVGGTSAVAPLWAALIARFNQALIKETGKPVQALHEALYSFPETLFHDITVGNNDGYSAKVGWDPTTGFGSPNGQAILTYLLAQPKVS